MSEKATMTGQLRSEWTKLRSLRSTWICLALVLILGVGLGALITFVEASKWSSLATLDRATFDPVRTSQAGVFVAQFVVGVLAALTVTSEYSSGSIRPTLAAVPRRSRVLAAKAVVLGIVVAVVAELTAVISFVTSRAILLHYGAVHSTSTSALALAGPRALPEVNLGDPGVLRALLLSGLYLVCLAMMALGVGFILRHTAGTISLYAVTLLVVPIIVALLPSSIVGTLQSYLPSNLGQAVSSVSTHTTYAGNLLGAQRAALFLLLYAGVLLAAGWWRLSRRDA